MILQAGPLADRTHGATITVLAALGVVAVLVVVLLALVLVRVVGSVRSSGRVGLRVLVWPHGPERSWPYVWVSGVLVILLAAVSVLYFVVPSGNSDDSAGGLSSEEQSAVNAAGTIVVNLSSFSRASFDKDFQRALAGTTGSLTTQVNGVKASTQSVLTKGGFDLSAKVEHAALVEQVPQTGKQKGLEAYVVMVVIYGYRSNSLNQPSPQNLIVTVQKSGGKWLASSVDSAGLQ